MAVTNQTIGILTTDNNLIVRTWDDWLSEVTGIPAEAAHNKPLATLIPDLLTRGWYERLDAALKEGSVQVLAPTLHRYLIPCAPRTASKYFDKMQQRITIAPLREGGVIIGTMITIEDVTQRRERERELREQLASPDEPTRLRAAEALAADSDEMLLYGALGDSSWRVRRVAVNQLAHKGGPEAVAALVRALKEEYKDANVLNSALQVLALGGLDVLPPLIDLLSSPDVDLRIYAALALGERRDAAAAPALLRLVEEANEDANVRYHAIEALGKIRDASAIPALLRIAESRDFYLAFPALDALAQIGNPSIVPQIVPLLHDDVLSAPAARLLGELGDENVVAPLATALNRPEAPAAALAEALARVYEREERRRQAGEGIADRARGAIEPSGVQNLLASIQAGDPGQLRAIAVVLGWLHGPAVDAALTRLLGEPSVRKEVVEALVRHGSGVIELLIRELGSPDLEIRQAAVIALGRIGDSRAVPALIQLLTTDPESSSIVAGALAKIGDRAAFEPLLTQIGNPNVATRQAVVSALNSLGHPDTCDRISDLLRDSNPNAREAAARIAGYFGYEGCLDLLINDLSHDPVEDVRRATVESIAYLDDPRVSAVLFHALAHETPAVRAAAARAGAHLEHPEVANRLLQSTRDGDMWVRYFAARSLRYHGGAETVERLADLAQNDPATPVRVAAIETLGAIGGPAIRGALETLTHSGEPDIARAANGALAALSKAP